MKRAVSQYIYIQLTESNLLGANYLNCSEHFIVIESDISQAFFYLVQIYCKSEHLLTHEVLGLCQSFIQALNKLKPNLLTLNDKQHLKDPV
jgi:hypothetical protein